MTGVPKGGSLQPRSEGELVGGKYKLERQLGEGGMGVVFAARHMGTRRRVAVKCIAVHANNITAHARFMREAQVAGRIDHPNVVQVLDVGEDPRGRYIVMECLQGETLAEVLKRRRLAPADAADVLIPAMRGVHAAHRRNIIHRDLKPENIFVCRADDGRPVQIKVLDFGISKLLEDDLGENLTRPGMLLGTPQYMSPDRLRGQGQADRRNDVYAMGVILFEALTGHRPFDGADLSEVMKRVARQNVPAINDLDPSLPAALGVVVRKAMAPQLEDRYQDIESFARALEAFAGTERFQQQVRDPTVTFDESLEPLDASAWAPFETVAAEEKTAVPPGRVAAAEGAGRAGVKVPELAGALAGGELPAASLRPPPPRPPEGSPARPPVAARPPTPSARAKVVEDAADEGSVRVALPLQVGAPGREDEGRSARPDLSSGVADEAVSQAADRLLGSLSVRAATPEARASQSQAGAEALREAALGQVRPVRELIFQLSLGRTPLGWIGAARSALAPLLEAARRVEAAELLAAFERFDAALKRVSSASVAVLDATASAGLQAAYRELSSQLPAACPAETAFDARRRALFEAVVLRAAGMQKRTIAKLVAAGVGSLEALGKASVDELGNAAGLDRDLAQALVRRAQQFERERQYQDLHDMKAQSDRRLRALAQRLEAHRIEFERAERDDAAERKRAARQGRDAVLLEVNQVLAELGELELAEELQRCPTHGKIEIIERYLKRLPAGAELA